MAQTNNLGQTPPQPEAPPYRGSTSAGPSDEGAGSLSGRFPVTSIPLRDPAPEQAAGLANTTQDETSRLSQRNPWESKTILTFGKFTALADIANGSNPSADGGGIRGLSSLLILQKLMTAIQEVERREPSADSSVHPLPQRTRRRASSQANSTQTSTIRSHDSQAPETPFMFLPAHYFDYIGGTSTGGYVTTCESESESVC